MNTKSKSGAVVIGGGIAALSTVRCLATRNIPVDIILTDPSDIAHHSRFVNKFYRLFGFHYHPASLIDFLEHKRELWKGWVLFPTSDEALTVLSRYLDCLSGHYRVISPRWEITQQILFKDLTYKGAKEVGINVPHIYGYASPEEETNKNIKFPVIVKPIVSRPFVKIFGVKLFVAANRIELLDCLRKLQDFGLAALIMDLVPGPDTLFYNYSVYIDRKGECIAELPMRKLRKSPPFYGVCRVAETTDIPQLREPTIELVRHIGWRGMANVEYKLSPIDGKYYLMEVNGRCFLMQGLSSRAGVNYPVLAWRESVTGEKVNASNNGWDGVWLNLADDIYYGSFYRGVERLSLRQYLSTYRRPKTYAVWSSIDPKPFIMHCYNEMKKVKSAVLSSRYRATLRSHVQGMPVHYGGPT